jgi:hypothetical protein
MRTLCLAALLALSACAQGPSRQQVLAGLIGAPETEVVRVMGIPTRTFETGGHKFLGYLERRADYIPAGPFFWGGSGWYGGGFGYAAFPPQVIERACETTFDLVGNRVVTYSLRGNACG